MTFRDKVYTHREENVRMQMAVYDGRFCGAKRLRFGMNGHLQKYWPLTNAPVAATRRKLQ